MNSTAGHFSKSGRSAGSSQVNVDLLSGLGFMAPTAKELADTLLRHAKTRFKRSPPFCVSTTLQASLISAKPLISYSGTGQAPLGLASELPIRLRFRQGWFLLSPTWSIEGGSFANALRGYAVVHRLLNPNHSIIFLCNTEKEVELMRGHGEAALFHNKTSSVSEAVFRPLEGVAEEFDAIYNAQLRAWKRHELSLEVERCAFVYYRDATGPATGESEARLIEKHARLAPGHIFVNRLGDAGSPIRLSPEEVNVQLNRAAVGLCLSEVEGAMFASTEYLLAGLPIVTTPSRGGRDVYLDDEYCLTVEPDPRSVAQAVAALKARKIPRTYIRRRTLERLNRDRGRFIDLLNQIFAKTASDRRLEMPWPFRRPVIMRWMDPAEAVRRARAGEVDAFADTPRG